MPVRPQLPALLLQKRPENRPRIIPARDKDLRVRHVEVAAPGQQERGFLVPKNDLGDVDEALEGLALLELDGAVLGLVALRGRVI